METGPPLASLSTEISNFSGERMSTNRDDARGAFTQTGDTGAAAGAMNIGFGRTSSNLASDTGPETDADVIAGIHAELFSGDDLQKDSAAADAPPMRTRKRNPDISPDARLGLRPAITRDAAPNIPVNPDLY
jgi:hypothetical protein